MININELSKRTGFSVVFIRKCLDKLGDILAPYTQRGEFNRILFDSNAIVIFDQIKQFKEDGLAIPEIRRKLERDLSTNTETAKSTGVKSEQTDEQSGEGGDMLNRLLQLHQRMNEEKEKRIQERDQAAQVIRELEKQNQHLSLTLKLLPEGKSPEELKAEWEEDQKRRREVAMIVGELKTLGVLQFIKRNRLMKRLEELLA